MYLRAAPIFLAALLLAGCGSSNSATGAATGTGTATSSSGGTGSVNQPGGENHVHSILITPTNANDIYLGTHYRLYRSTNGGGSWHALLKQMVLSMALDPNRPTEMYAISLQAGLEKSTDGGQRWTVISAGPAKGKVTGVLFDPTDRAVVAYGYGIYRSTDGGNHWTHTLAAESIANVAAGSAGTLYAAAGDGLFISRDGTHWSSVKIVAGQPVVQVAVSGTVAYADAAVQVLKSTDAGHSWKPLNRAPQGIEYFSVSPSNPNELIGEVAQQGFVVSHDGGASWHPANRGIHDHNFSASTIRIAPSASLVAYTGSWGVHFYATHDGGRYWARVATLTS